VSDSQPSEVLFVRRGAKSHPVRRGSAGRCQPIDPFLVLPAVPSNRDYQGGFASGLMLKDLKLAQTAAQSAGAATPLSAEAERLYALFVARGYAGLDFSGIIRMLRGEL
jgi:3-hydroxyisobutyrate dehydrogenase